MLFWLEGSRNRHILEAEAAMDRAVPEPFEADDSGQEGVLLLSAFRKAATALGLALPEQAAILGISRAALVSWKVNPGLDSDKLDRMALFVGLFGLAGSAFPGERGAEGWLRRPNANPVFGGKPPLALLLEGRFESLLRTYDHLQTCVRVW
jgi:uncharacterized protein (DUF2384 family)